MFRKASMTLLFQMAAISSAFLSLGWVSLYQKN